MKKLLREPLFHFLLIGAGLFLLFGWRSGPAPVPGGTPGSQSTKVTVTQADIDQIFETFSKTWHRTPTEIEIKGLVEDFVRDEIYYREAKALGLDRDDTVIRRRMRQRMEFVFEDIASVREPTDGELQTFMKKHSDKYALDPQISFRHVYVNPDKRKKETEAYAAEILARLNGGADPDTVGDPFLLGSEIRLSPVWEISKQFGETFSNKLVGLKQGKWEGPVRSGFGLHLVQIDIRVEGRFPDLKEVRDIVKRDWMAEHQNELKDAAYAKLRERYSVEIEKPKPATSLTTAKARAGGAEP